MKKKLIVLGSTGSIGTNTLQVIDHLRDKYEVVGLACRGNVDLLQKQVQRFRPRAVALSAYQDESNLFDGATLYTGDEGIRQMIAELKPDAIVNGISGSAGLLSSHQSLQAGIDLLLANKESMVMAGTLLVETASAHNARIVPVDSEHFALFTMLDRLERDKVERIVLTASGGAFRDLPFSQWPEVSLQDALSHPNWNMGPKNTIDSATMANKGLELIEAQHLFGMEVDQIEVLIHPQSCVHALVRTRDGFYYCQVSQPDMRMVIQGALSFPDMYGAQFGLLDLVDTTLTFEAVDPQKYRMLLLAIEAAKSGGAYPVVYNAANEAALELFLNQEIRFVDIPALVEELLSFSWADRTETVEQILEIDEQAREKTSDFAKNRKRVIL